ncbi:MAG: beta-ketoacyl-ACP synthase III [Actinomycetota bacterium]
MPRTPSSARGATILGWGTNLPEKILTNHDLEKMVETSHDWIVERSGIHERHVGGSTIPMAIAAGRMAIERSGIDPSSIDALILATTTPDKQWGNSAAVQDALGLRCGVFELNSACSGFVYGLVAAHGMIAVGLNNVLVIGADTLSRITDWTDRNTAVLFGDGAGAVVVSSCDGPGELVAWDIDADGSAGSILWAEVGGTIQMEGKEVFRRAVRIMVDSAEKTMAQAGVTGSDVSLVIPHQANVRIIQAACDRLGIPIERTSIVLDRTGNTSAASIPLALVDALDKNRIAEGDLVLLVGFGGGMTAASALLRWGPIS